MIGGWLVKVVLGLALLGFVAVEVASPWVAKAQADGAATDIATEAAFAFRRQRTVEAVRSTCAAEAAEHDVKLETCEVNREGTVTVKVSKDAFSFVMDNFSFAEDYYVATATATVERPGG